MKESIHHMSVNIEGMLRNYKGRKILFFSDDNDKQLSDKEARAFIAEKQALGHKLICCAGDQCEGFDPFGGGCPGHETKSKEVGNEK